MKDEEAKIIFFEVKVSHVLVVMDARDILMIIRNIQDELLQRGYGKGILLEYEQQDEMLFFAYTAELDTELIQDL